MAAESRTAIRKQRVSLRKLVESGAPEARGKLEGVALDSDARPDLRREAIYLLGRNFPDSVSQLIPLVEADNESFDVRAAVIGTVDDNKLTQAIEAIKRIAENHSEPVRIRSRAISTLVHLDAKVGRPLLLATVADTGEDAGLRRSLVYELYPETNDQARELLLQLVHDRDEEVSVRSVAIKRLADVPSVENELFLSILQDTDEQFDVRHSALTILSRRDDDSAVDALIKLAQDNSLPRGIRLDIVSVLASHSHRPEVRAMAIDAIVNEPGSGAGRYFRVTPDTNWKQVLDEFIRVLKMSGKQHNQIDAAGIIHSLNSATQEPGDIFSSSRVDTAELQEALIKAVLDADERMTGILGKLLVETAEGDQAVAGASINAYQSKHSTPPEKLRRLRIAVGGETALDPIMQTLSENLEDRFHKPIKEINDQTRQMWDQTISHAQNGFLVRIWMSVIVFAVGIILLLVSSYQFLSGNASGAALYGSGVSFVAGLAMTLLVVYSGPLKEIRQSVNDLGIANASFIAYVHRVLEISHTFSFYYLQKRMTFEEMEKSSKLIQEAMFDAVKSFRFEAIDSPEESLTSVLERALKANIAPKPEEPAKKTVEEST